MNISGQFLPSPNFTLGIKLGTVSQLGSLRKGKEKDARLWLEPKTFRNFEMVLNNVRYKCPFDKLKMVSKS